MCLSQKEKGLKSGRFAFTVALTTTAVAAGVLSPMAPAGASARPSGPSHC